jgi:hypothetical protein
MKKMTSMFFCLSLVLSAAMMSGGIPGTALSQEQSAAKIKPEMKLHGTEIINITDDMQQPVITKIKSGTTVVWWNGTHGILEFEFTGKQVTMACARPVNFFLNKQESFSSYKILQAEVASLCFIEKGAFNYKLTIRPEGIGAAGFRQELQGTIIVE